MGGTFRLRWNAAFLAAGFTRPLEVPEGIDRQLASWANDARSRGYTVHDLTRPPGIDYEETQRRHPFQRDRDRIIHSPAFRQLQGKTQVVTPGQADFFRTRLTHTLEVAQVARRLAQILGAHPTLCEAAALGHDLGHPPFGHIGEEALCDAIDAIVLEPENSVADGNEVAFGGFEGNAQTLRFALLTTGAAKLHLTRATLDSFIKYPNLRPPKALTVRQKWNVYPTEKQAFEWIRQPDPSIDRKCFEAQIMDWADDIAYAIHDLEDWYRAGYMPLTLLTLSQTARTYLYEQVRERRRRRQPMRDGPERDTLDRQLETDVEELFTPAPENAAFASFAQVTEPYYDGSANARQALEVMKRALYSEFIDHAPTVTYLDPSMAARRHLADLEVDPRASRRNAVLREMLWIYVIDHPRMATHQAGQRRIVQDLVKFHYGIIVNPSSRERAVLPRRMREFAEANSEDSAILLRTVADHVAGMTDLYAARLHARITGYAPGAFNEFI